MSTHHANQASDRKSVGQRIDEVLEPFIRDRARLRNELKEQTALRAKVEEQIKQIQLDLAVVERSMLESLREAAAHDPLLSAAFKIKPDDTKTTGAIKRSDSNPLLNPAASD